MLWVVSAVTFAAGVVTLMVILSKPRADGHDLGSVSDHWIAEHRAEP